MSKTGRNEPCPCGSGKKYKHCCGNKSNVIPFPNQNSNNQNADAFKEYETLTNNWKAEEPPPTFMEMQGKPNIATEGIKKIFDELKEKNFSSEEELDKYMNNYNEQLNTKSIKDFLGLSPEQMHNILHAPFKDNTEIFSLSININENDIKDMDALIRQLGRQN